MKKYMILSILIVLLMGCETGTRYDKNTTTQTLPKKELQSGLVDRDDIEALLEDKETEESFTDERIDERDFIVTEQIEELKEHGRTFSNGVVSDGLDVRKIREGKHEGYIRLVFDVYNDSKPAQVVGRYDVKHNNTKKDITVVLHGYRKFSASLPSFPYYSIIEQIHFDEYPDDSGFKFHIKLRKNAEVKIFDLKNPARIVFDIKAI